MAHNIEGIVYRKSDDLPDLDHLIQALMEAKNRYGGHKPIMVETHNDLGWYEGVSIISQEGDESVVVHLIFTPSKQVAGEGQ